MNRYQEVFAANLKPPVNPYYGLVEVSTNFDDAIRKMGELYKARSEPLITQICSDIHQLYEPQLDQLKQEILRGTFSIGFPGIFQKLDEECDMVGKAKLFAQSKYKIYLVGSMGRYNPLGLSYQNEPIDRIKKAIDENPKFRKNVEEEFRQAEMRRREAAEIERHRQLEIQHQQQLAAEMRHREAAEAERYRQLEIQRQQQLAAEIQRREEAEAKLAISELKQKLEHALTDEKKLGYFSATVVENGLNLSFSFTQGNPSPENIKEVLYKVIEQLEDKSDWIDDFIIEDDNTLSITTHSVKSNELLQKSLEEILSFPYQAKPQFLI